MGYQNKVRPRRFLFLQHAGQLLQVVPAGILGKRRIIGLGFPQRRKNLLSLRLGKRIVVVKRRRACHHSPYQPAQMHTGQISVYLQPLCLTHTALFEFFLRQFHTESVILRRKGVQKNQPAHQCRICPRKVPGIQPALGMGKQGDLPGMRNLL